MVFFLYRMRRVDCRDCDVKVERVPWAEGTLDFIFENQPSPFEAVFDMEEEFLAWRSTGLMR